jgi:ABC-type multidrug transport system ATPase subunit
MVIPFFATASTGRRSVQPRQVHRPRLALDSVSMHVVRGSVLGVLGPE